MVIIGFFGLWSSVLFWILNWSWSLSDDLRLDVVRRASVAASPMDGPTIIGLHMPTKPPFSVWGKIEKAGKLRGFWFDLIVFVFIFTENVFGWIFENIFSENKNNK